MYCAAELRRITLSAVVLFSFLPPLPAAGADVVLERTLSTIAQMPGVTEQKLEYARKAVSGMDYNTQRAVRKISLLPGGSFELSRKIWAELTGKPLSFDQLLAFEQWAELEGAAMPQTMNVLTELRELKREALKTFRAALRMNGINAASSLRMLPLISSIDDSSRLAARGLFNVKGMDAQQALSSLPALRSFSKKQAWAFALFAETRGMTPQTALTALPHFRELREDDAWNMQYLIKLKKPNAKAALSWLREYFLRPMAVQEAQYYRMSELNRAALIDSYYQAGEEIVWEINNLHAVTDEDGREYSQGRLHSMAAGDLQALFDRLSPTTRSRFASARRPGERGRLVSVLRQATAADRTQVAEDLTSANIYALLAQGSELYDSSFRDILVPILKKRIGYWHRDNLLVFLRATDPSNQLVSSFVVSLAQKGKLTDFFPQDAGEQQRILELVAASAFKDEDSILLFSATFRYLLTVLEPPARDYLIRKMAAADSGQGSFSKLITVILQYYLQEYPELLSQESSELIRQVIARNGAVNLRRYLATPFAEWKQDGQLGSLSIFHPDDDGRDSFVSNARLLTKNGYKIMLSEQYSLVDNPGRYAALVAQAPSQGFSQLFSAMSNAPFSVAFVKRANGIVIRHSVHVYGDEESQQRIMRRFLKGGDEMFVQRGHSYWRSEQITDPIRKLRENEQIADGDLLSKQRFMSLGSCGGVKAYTKLTRMFLGRLDILATIGTGMAMINDPYNLHFFEIVVENSSSMTWEDMARKTSFIFSKGRGQDYLQPGCLTAVLHKILDEDKARQGGWKLEDAEDESSF
jgi:hypothetical protein